MAPRRGGWSVSQTIQHLAQSEDAIARGIEVGNAGKLRVQKRGSDPLRRLLLYSNLYKVTPIRTTPALDPAKSLPRAEAITQINASRTRLLAAIEDGERKGLWGYRLRHPVFGLLSMAEMLQFSAYHEERHRMQIVRIKAALAREAG